MTKRRSHISRWLLVQVFFVAILGIDLGNAQEHLLTNPSVGIMYGFNHTAETIPAEFRFGAVTLRITATPLPADTFPLFELIIDSLDGVEYSGPRVLTAPAYPNTTTIFDLDISIPENGTYGMIYHIRGGGGIHGVTRELYYYWTTTDTAMARSFEINIKQARSQWVQPFRFDSTHIYRMAEEECNRPKPSSSVHPLPDSEMVKARQERRYRYGQEYLQKLINEGKLAPDFDSSDPKIQEILGIAKPTQVAPAKQKPEPVVPALPLSQRERRKVLEQETESGVFSNLFIDDTMFVRSMGEREYRPAPIQPEVTTLRTREDTARLLYRDYRGLSAEESIRENGSTCYGELDLRNPEHHKLTRHYGVFVPSTSNDGKYRVRMSEKQRHLLVDEAGIPFVQLTDPRTSDVPIRDSLAERKKSQ